MNENMSSTPGEKPRSGYVMLTEEEIEELRPLWASPLGDDRRFYTLCDMAISALLYADEIHRLRSALSETGEKLYTKADIEALCAIAVAAANAAPQVSSVKQMPEPESRTGARPAVAARDGQFDKKHLLELAHSVWVATGHPDAAHLHRELSVLSATLQSTDRAAALEETLQVCLATSFQYRKDADDMELRNVPMPQVNQLLAMASGIEIIYGRIRALKKSQYVKVSPDIEGANATHNDEPPCSKRG